MSNHLPPNWAACLDSETGHTYYQNSITRVTQWERPVPGGDGATGGPVAMHVPPQHTIHVRVDVCPTLQAMLATLQVVVGIVAVVAGIIALFVEDWLVCVFSLLLGFVVMSVGLLQGCSSGKTYAAYGNFLAVLLSLAGLVTFAVVYGRNRNRSVDVDWISYVCCPADMSVPDCTELCFQGGGYGERPANWNEVGTLCQTSGGSRCTKQSKCTPERCSSRHTSGFSHYDNCWADPDDGVTDGDRCLAGEVRDDRCVAGCEVGDDRCVAGCDPTSESGERVTDFTPLQTGKKARRKVETTGLLFSLVALVSLPRPAYYCLLSVPQINRPPPGNPLAKNANLKNDT